MKSSSKLRIKEEPSLLNSFEIYYIPAFVALYIHSYHNTLEFIELFYGAPFKSDARPAIKNQGVGHAHHSGLPVDGHS